MKTRTGGRLLAVALLSLFGASVSAGFAADAATTTAVETEVKPFGWKGRESALTIEDKVTVAADGKGCVLSGSCH